MREKDEPNAVAHSSGDKRNATPTCKQHSPTETKHLRMNLPFDSLKHKLRAIVKRDGDLTKCDSKLDRQDRQDRIACSDADNDTLRDFGLSIPEHDRNLLKYLLLMRKNSDGAIATNDLAAVYQDMDIDFDSVERRSLHTANNLSADFKQYGDWLRPSMTPSTFYNSITEICRLSAMNPMTPLGLRNRLTYDNVAPASSNANTDLPMMLWVRYLTAGGIAGAVSRTCTAPLDRLKIFLQTQQPQRSVLSTVHFMLQDGGVRSLWRGNEVSVMKIVPEFAIKFAAYEKCKCSIRGYENRDITIKERFLAGAAAGTVAQTLIYPMDVLKVRMALSSTGQYDGMLHAAKKIYLREGLRSFYRGYLPNILGIMPYAGIDLAAYETLKRHFMQRQNKERADFLLVSICGSISSAFAHFVAYPLTLVRTKMQAQVVPLGRSDTPPYANHMLGMFRHIVSNEGYMGLYNGLTPNIIKVVPAVCISYVVYEYCCTLLGVTMT